MKKILVSVMALSVLLSSCFASFAAIAAEPADISSAVITTKYNSYTYRASELQPKVNVSLGEKKLKLDKDYTVKYENNVNVGTAKITVTGTGAYTGEAYGSFQVAPLKITNSAITYTLTKKAYPSSAPAYTVTYKGANLVEGKDYTVDVKNYAKAGVKSGTYTVKGIGNFTSSKAISFNVYPNTVTAVKAKNRTENSLTLLWNSQSEAGVTGYEVYTCDKKGNNAKLYKTVKSETVKVTGLSAGSAVYFKVRAYVTANKKTVNGDFSKVYSTATKPEAVAIKSVTKSSDGKKLVVKWKKVTGSGYIIEYSSDKKFKKGIKTVNVNKASAESKSIKIKNSKKTYYARVRAIKKYNGGKKVVKGKWSSKISSDFSKVYETYTTHYVNNPRRTTNLKLACKAIDGTIVAPGETFSFNETVGKRTAAKGYKPAPVFVGRTGHENGIGGGVCQVASTMFNTTLYSDFQIVERHQHSQRVTYVPLGRDAAIYWGSCDFKFKNTSNYPIKIKMTCANGKLTCTYYVSADVSPKKVKLSVSRSGNHFTLRRKVGGKTNYTAYSTY